MNFKHYLETLKNKVDGQTVLLVEHFKKGIFDTTFLSSKGDEKKKKKNSFLQQTLKKKKNS